MAEPNPLARCADRAVRVYSCACAPRTEGAVPGEGGPIERVRTVGAPSATGMLNAHDHVMDILTWVIVGLVAGLLASLLVGSGGGILIDIVIGVLGALIGGWLFTAAGWHVPFAGIAGTIFVAFIGSVILLVVLQLIRGRPEP